MDIPLTDYSCREQPGRMVDHSSSDKQQQRVGRVRHDLYDSSLEEGETDGSWEEGEAPDSEVGMVTKVSTDV